MGENKSNPFLYFAIAIVVIGVMIAVTLLLR